MEKETLVDLIEKKLTTSEISRELNLSNSGLRYWLAKYGLKPKCEYKSDKWSKENLFKNISASETKSDVLRRLGILVRPGNFKTFDRYVKLYNLDTSHFDIKFHKNRFNNRKYKNEDIFIKNSTYSNNTSLKKRIKTENLIKYECSICKNNGKWNNIELVLQLDHKNGINNDNELSNLRFLCPNCHSQTANFCSKNMNNKR